MEMWGGFVILAGWGFGVGVGVEFGDRGGGVIAADGGGGRLLS